jgi:CheY-like chemotaxis protein
MRKSYVRTSYALQGEGFGVITAANGSDALAQLHNAVPPPCLILLDLTMPVMDGWTFVTERDKNPAFASIPLVVVSGTHDLQVTAASLHATAYIRKPLQAAHLIAMAHRHCGTPRLDSIDLV